MKRILCTVLSFAMMISICSCGAKEGLAESSANAASVDTETSSPAEAEDSSAGIEVDSGLFNVTITVPADFVGEVTQNELDEEASTKGYQSAILNSDGSVTYVMTKTQHQELMHSIRESIGQGIQEMADSEDYPTIVSIKVNDDYSQYIIEIDGAEVGLVESFATLALYVFSGMYHAFNGTDIENVSVQFINQSTGEMIQEANSKDMEQAQN